MGKARTRPHLHMMYGCKKMVEVLRPMRAFPKPLSAKEEKECITRCRAGDKSAREELIKRNLRLVAYIAKKYNTGDKELEDLISIGTIGLIKGIDTFDENKNIRLATYAARCIDKGMQQIDDIV